MVVTQSTGGRMRTRVNTAARMPRTVLLVLVVVVLCFARPIAAGAPTTVFPGARWEEATPQSQGVDAARLHAAVDLLGRTVGSDGTRELAVIRHGRMIWKGDDIDRGHGVWSVTKSFTSTVLGLLFLNNGAWNGRQLVPESWVREATRVQVPAGWFPIGGMTRLLSNRSGKCRHATGVRPWIRTHTLTRPPRLLSGHRPCRGPGSKLSFRRM